MLLFIWLNIHSCVLVGVDVCSMGTIWGELFWESCVVELYGGSCGELCSAIVWGAVLGGAVWGRCVGDHVESCVGSSGRSWGELWEGGHAHQSLDSPGIHTPLPPVLLVQGGFPTTLSATALTLSLPTAAAR